MQRGFEALRGAHVVADLHQPHITADSDAVGAAQVLAARRGQLEAVPGVLDQFDRVVVGVGRVVAFKQLRCAGAVHALPADPPHRRHLERSVAVGLTQLLSQDFLILALASSWMAVSFRHEE